MLHAYRIWDWFGYHFSEFAFRANRASDAEHDRWRWYHSIAYRIGCNCYGRGFRAALRIGALVENPQFGKEPHGFPSEPKYIRAPGY